MPLFDILQTMTVSTGNKYRASTRYLRTGLTVLTGYSPYVPKHLLIAPQDLRTADASYAQEYYGGRYVLAGKLVETGGKSPFEIESADRQWKRELHSFGWLCNLSAASDQLSGNHAKSLVRDWVNLNGKTSDEDAWNVDVASRRLIAWLQHSILILSVPDHSFHQEFMHSLGVHVRFLKRHASVTPSGSPRLIAYLALAYASICFSGHASSLAFSEDRLNQELELQILPDGSHVSRNPEKILEVASYLLPFRQGCLAVDRAPSDEVMNACERLLLGLRFFRLGDGNFGRFNGCGATEADLLSTLLRYDEAAIAGFNNSSSGGYQRFENQNAVVLMDAGTPPKGELSQEVHAGCLSFEFSSGVDCVVVNAGTPPIRKTGVSALWRATAAHSTAVMNETSSCKFENSGQSESLMDGQMFSNSLKIDSSRTSDKSHEIVEASHLGYVREFGARHQRTLKFDRDTGRIEGEDWFTGPDKGDLYYTTRDTVAIHFHLHPNINAEVLEEENTIILKTRSGKVWNFVCNGLKPTLEESIYFASLTGPQNTHQIVLRFNACKTPLINWTFSPVEPRKESIDGSNTQEP